MNNHLPSFPFLFLYIITFMFVWKPELFWSASRLRARFIWTQSHVMVHRVQTSLFAWYQCTLYSAWLMSLSNTLMTPEAKLTAFFFYRKIRLLAWADCSYCWLLPTIRNLLQVCDVLTSAMMQTKSVQPHHELFELSACQSNVWCVPTSVKRGNPSKNRQKKRDRRDKRNKTHWPRIFAFFAIFSSGKTSVAN